MPLTVRRPAFAALAFRGLALLALIATPAVAAGLAQPSGPVVLTVKGPLDRTNAERAAEFDLAMLDSLPQRVTTTTTPWHDGPQVFAGPRLSDLVAAVGARGSALRVVGIDDYSAVLPWSEFADAPVILATRVNGRPMTLRQYGPLLIVYPFDEFPELRREVQFSRSVWQVVGIEVLP